MGRTPKEFTAILLVIFVTYAAILIAGCAALSEGGSRDLVEPADAKDQTPGPAVTTNVTPDAMVTATPPPAKMQNAQESGERTAGEYVYATPDPTSSPVQDPTSTTDLPTEYMTMTSPPHHMAVDRDSGGVACISAEYRSDFEGNRVFVCEVTEFFQRWYYDPETWSVSPGNVSTFGFYGVDGADVELEEFVLWEVHLGFSDDTGWYADSIITGPGEGDVTYSFRDCDPVHEPAPEPPPSLCPYEDSHMHYEMDMRDGVIHHVYAETMGYTCHIEAEYFFDGHMDQYEFHDTATEIARYYFIQKPLNYVAPGDPPAGEYMPQAGVVESFYYRPMVDGVRGEKKSDDYFFRLKHATLDFYETSIRRYVRYVITGPGEEQIWYREGKLKPC